MLFFCEILFMFHKYKESEVEIRKVGKLLAKITNTESSEVIKMIHSMLTKTEIIHSEQTSNEKKYPHASGLQPFFHFHSTILKQLKNGLLWVFDTVSLFTNALLLRLHGNWMIHSCFSLFFFNNTLRFPQWRNLLHSIWLLILWTICSWLQHAEPNVWLDL